MLKLLAFQGVSRLGFEAADPQLLRSHCGVCPFPTHICLTPGPDLLAHA